MTAPELAEICARLDKIDAKLDPKSSDYMLTPIHTHMNEVKPILEGLRGARVIGEGLKWLAAVGVAVLAIKGIFFTK